jgi:hypothetical protein
MGRQAESQGLTTTRRWLQDLDNVHKKIGSHSVISKLLLALTTTSGEKSAFAGGFECGENMQRG